MKLNLSLLLLRLGFGGSMLYGHGIGKLNKLLAGGPYEFGDPLGIGVGLSLSLATFAEAICAFFLILGFQTRWSAIPLVITMGVAILAVYIDDPFRSMEKAILFLVAFLVMAILGGGRFSVDALLRR